MRGAESIVDLNPSSPQPIHVVPHRPVAMTACKFIWRCIECQCAEGGSIDRSINNPTLTHAYTHTHSWYFANYQSGADKKIYFVDYKSQADLVIYFTSYQSGAGWKNSSKKWLME